MTDLDAHITGWNDPRAPFNENRAPSIQERLAKKFPHYTDVINALGLDNYELEHDFAQDYCGGRHWEGWLQEDPYVADLLRACYEEELSALL